MRASASWPASGMAAIEGADADSVGIAGLLQASQPAFVVLKIVGAGYLAFLGVQSILAAVRGRHGKEDRDMRPREIGA